MDLGDKAQRKRFPGWESAAESKTDLNKKSIHPMSVSEVLDTIARWDQAIVNNDVNQITQFMTEDWVIVGSDGLTSKSDFLSQIESGNLTHNRMDSDETNIRIHDNTAIVISKGTSAGTWMGQAFSLYEWSASVFIRSEGKWLCSVTMPTKVGGE